MLKAFRLFVLLLVGFSSVGHAQTKIDATTRNVLPAGEPVALAQNAKALLPIIVSPHASETTRAAASELAGYLERITGAPFSVEEGNGAQGIVVGTVEEFPDTGLQQALQVIDGVDGKESFVIRTQPGLVRLLGATDRGAQHAVYRFLHRLGCRWFFPSPTWEVIPRDETLSVAINETDRPEIWARDIWFTYGLADFEADDHPHATYEAWKRRNLLGSSFKVSMGHMFDTIIASHPEEFKAHPEYLALTKGERKGPQLCVSNPALQELVIAFAGKRFDQNPDAEMISMDPADGGGICECEGCTKLGTMSNQGFLIANVVAKALQVSHPGKMVGVYAYSWHSEPPDYEMEPNVVVQLTSGFLSGKYTYRELVKLWQEKCKRMGYYEYFSVWEWDRGLPTAGVSNLDYVKHRIPFLVQNQATNFSAESGNNWGIQGPGYLLATRLAWDSSQNADEVIEDFYTKAFGPSAPAIKEFYSLLCAQGYPVAETPFYGPSLYSQAAKSLKVATELAKGNEAVLERIGDLKMYLHYVLLLTRFDEAKEIEDVRRTGYEWLNFSHWVRNTGMVHWSAVYQAGLRSVANRLYALGDQDAVNLRKYPTWKVAAEPYTRVAGEKLFLADVASLPEPQDVAKVSFSNDLVPVAMDPPEEEPVTIVQTFQGGMTFAVYSPGALLEGISVTHGLVNPKGPKGTYSLRDKAGKLIAEGAVDPGKTPLSLTTPSAGVYLFEFNDLGTGGRVEIRGETPSAVALERGKRIIHHGLFGRRYFYVPSGAQFIQFYASRECGQIQIINPDGQLVLDAACDGTVVTLPTDGYSGQVWTLTGSRFAINGQFWLFNAPNYLSAQRGVMLLPREVVKADGLTSLE